MLQGDRAGAGKASAQRQVIRRQGDVARRASGNRVVLGDAVAGTGHRHVHCFTGCGGDGRQGQRVGTGEGDIAQRRRAAPGAVEADAAAIPRYCQRRIDAAAEGQRAAAGIKCEAAAGGGGGLNGNGTVTNAHAAATAIHREGADVGRGFLDAAETDIAAIAVNGCARRIQPD